MKKAYIMTLLLIGFIHSFAQVTEVELNEPLAGDFQIEASSQIKLTKGFNTMGYNFTAKITNSYLPPTNGGTPPVISIAVPSTDKNYVHTISPREAFTDTELATLLSSGNGTQNQVTEQISYFDGLGRPLQSISVKASPTGKDVVKHTIYDEFGRVSQDYLPFSVTNARPGEFVSGLFNTDNTPNAITGVYTNMYASNPSIEPTQYPYSQTVFDGSPLNRVMKQGAPGLDWQPDHTTTDRLATEHVTSFEYAANLAQDNVWLWKVSTNNELVFVQAYSTGTLYKNSAYDENHNPTVEYKDFEGKVIMKKSYDGSQWLRTQYVYDDFGMLRFVITPLADVAFSPPGLITYPNDYQWIKDLCYYYQYDAKKRMTLKRLPGAGPVKMVYDNRDRLILTQDGNMRPGGLEYWLFTLYDALNRPVVTGRLTAPAETSFNEDHTQWTITKTGSGYDLDNVFQTEVITHTVYTKTFYDTYPDHIFDYTTCIGLYNDAVCDDNNDYEPQVTGMVTRTQTRIGTTGDLWETNTPYYDEYGRVIWNKRSADFSNGLTGTEITSTKYAFTGEALQTKQTQTFNGTTTTIDKFMEYDHTGRLQLVQMQVNSGTLETLAQYFYNELGELQEKWLADGLQKLNYEYNERGWLTKVNDPLKLVNGDETEDLFAFNLIYNSWLTSVNDITDKQYNGNITAMQWTALNNNQQMERQAYGFTYDGINRLKTANYALGQLEPVNDGFINSLTAKDDYKVSGIVYDLNGNIQSINRWEKGTTTAGPIDQLVYNYAGNKLIGVNDNATGTVAKGFKDGLAGDVSSPTDENTWEYRYDNNGNLTKDQNKGIDGITYNHLNLPTKIYKNLDAQTTNWLLKYQYSATGEKFIKEKQWNFIMDPDNPATEKNYYFSNFEYNNNMDLTYIHTTEGRVRFNGGSPEYDYYLKDHLGNTRVVFTEENGAAKELQVSNYYPFGMRFNQSATVQTAEGNNQYLYNGKELQEDFDLDWYDYGFRMYDATLGRWGVIDPKAENYINESPYCYVGNRPLIMIDPDGMAYKPTTDSTGAYTGFEWVEDSEAYDKDGNLNDGYFEKGILFSDNGNWTLGTSSGGRYISYNLGSATATVYDYEETENEDGTVTKTGTTTTYDATINPADPNEFGTVQKGLLLQAVKHKHRGYPALQMRTLSGSAGVPAEGTNPSNGSALVWGANIHRAGFYSRSKKSYFTGTFYKQARHFGATSSNIDGTQTYGFYTKTRYSGVSEGCYLIDNSKWSSFMNHFPAGVGRIGVINK